VDFLYCVTIPRLPVCLSVQPLAKLPPTIPSHTHSVCAVMFQDEEEEDDDDDDDDDKDVPSSTTTGSSVPALSTSFLKL